MAIDLGTAYISVVPTTKDLDKGIRQALEGSVKHADKTGSAMGARIADNITTHLTKAGDKSGDAFARGFGTKVQSAGRSALQGLANLMVGSAQGIGSELGGGISAGMTGAINKGAVQAIDSLSAVGVKGGAAMSSKLQTAGMVAAGGVALVSAAAVAATAELYNIGKAWDDISDSITATTGKVGDELTKITDSVKKVALDTAAAPGDIAKVTAELVQTLKLSGDDLELLTKRIADYNSMNEGAPVNVREFARAMKQFGVTSASELADTLDRLNNVSQNTGIPLNELISSIRAAGPVAREFKMPLSEITQLLSTFEEAGLNAQSAATILKLALGNLAKADPGADPVVALQNVIAKIAELSSAGRELEAIDLAKGTFGKSWDQILPLIQQNKLEIDNLDTSIGKLGPSIEEQRKATEDFAEEWRKFKNFLEIELAPAAEVVFNGISNLIKGTLGVATQNIKDIQNFFGGGDQTEPGMMIPGGGGPNAQRERRGLTPTDPTGGLLGGGIPGTAGRGFFNSGAASGWLNAQAAMPAGGGAEGWRPAVRAAIAQYGPQLGITNSKAWEDALVRQIATESGGNPRADNPSDSNGRGGKQHVSGLLQFLPETFNSHNISGGAYLDPQAQIAAALHYVINRYGVDINGAPLQIGRGVGYSIGGAISGAGSAKSDSIPAWLSNGEHVLSAADVAAMGGQAGVYAFRNALHRDDGGPVLPLEDEPGWNPDTMGNKRRGPLEDEPGWNPDTMGNRRRGPLEDQPGWDWRTMGNQRRGHDYVLMGGNHIKGYADGGAIEPNLQQLIDQGVDPNTLIHGSGKGAAPGPAQTTNPQDPNYGMDFVRSLGFIPAAAGNTGVAGTSSLAGFINMGNEVVGGIIDTGANLAQTAAAAAIAAGSMGSSAAAGPAASIAASYGIQLGANELKRVSSYWFQMAGIGADALIEQLFPFGAPRWAGYDYTSFAPQLGIQQAFTSTIEKMGTDAINKAFAKPGEAPPPSPAGPVNPATMPGMPQTAPPPADQTNLAPSGPTAPVAPPADGLIPNLLAYDQGGMLAPGQLGINLTNRPEPVLTPQQWSAIEATSASPMHGAPLVNNLYAQDMQDAIRQLEKVKRRDMMQYAGRP